MPFSKQDCIDALHEAAEILGTDQFSLSEYAETGLRPKSETPFVNHFGTWNNAKEEAGLRTNTIRVSKSDCLDSLRRLADELGRPPGYNDHLDADTQVSTGSIENKWGTFNAAKEAAGLDTTEQWESIRDVDEDYFKTIDSGEKAYWLGFILGDGSVVEHEDRGCRRLAFGMDLQIRDIDHLKSFSKAINSTYPVREVTRNTTYASVRITNKAFCETLISQGIVPRKTREGEPVIPPEEYRGSFIRGWFDADGHIHAENDRVTIAATNTEQISSLGEMLSDENIPNIIKTYPREGESNADVNHLYVRSDGIGRFKQLTYPHGDDTTPKLERKYRRF